MNVINETFVAAAGHVLDLHAEMLGQEGNTETLLRHLLVSLNELCAAQGVDFERVLQESRHTVQTDAAHSPAWARQLRQGP